MGLKIISGLINKIENLHGAVAGKAAICAVIASVSLIAGGVAVNQTSQNTSVETIKTEQLVKKREEEKSSNKKKAKNSHYGAITEQAINQALTEVEQGHSTLSNQEKKNISVALNHLLATPGVKKLIDEKAQKVTSHLEQGNEQKAQKVVTNFKHDLVHATSTIAGLGRIFNKNSTKEEHKNNTSITKEEQNNKKELQKNSSSEGTDEFFKRVNSRKEMPSATDQIALNDANTNEDSRSLI